jgi:spore coat polysaccharide biosynthesis protein SpsF
MKKYSSSQEEFWANDFGNEYIKRNQGDKLLASNLNFFSRCLNRTYNINSVIEFGANIGMNLRALQLLFPGVLFNGIEINSLAATELEMVISKENVINESIFEYEPIKKFDLVLIKGVLIHLNPDLLDQAYEKLYSSSSKYLLIAEYYNPTPVSIAYRGHTDRLFKRDFAGEFLDKYKDLKILDYGFGWHRDPNFPLDDISWFLLSKV